MASGDGDNSCPATIEQHIVDVWAGLRLVGAGGQCETVYKALTEYAEELRQANHFKVYIPKGGGLVARAVIKAVEEFQAKRQRASAAAANPPTTPGADYLFPSSLIKN